MAAIADPLAITASLSLDPAEITISFIRASGPGGQNVNKVSTAAQLRFDLIGSPSLPAALKARAAKLAGSRLTNDGIVVITADRHRTQVLNRDDAIARLSELLKDAAVPPKPRRATRPTLASKTRRLDGKAKRAGVKKMRSNRPGLD
ncbi:MAG: alternative ribosome rescue aminoacyl-tRNA hydrolase ArfB [Devosia sp.]|nr:alternative ribosome rescue aminoacyl-tRNA hydrolase ArfB [Devosia sp.]